MIAKIEALQNFPLYSIIIATQPNRCEKSLGYYVYHAPACVSSCVGKLPEEGEDRSKGRSMHCIHAVYACTI